MRKSIIKKGSAILSSCLSLAIQGLYGASMQSSGDALMEGNEHMTYDDLDFLREFLGWKDAWGA